MWERPIFGGGAGTETRICFYGIKVYRRLFIRTHRPTFSSPQNHHEGPFLVPHSRQTLTENRACDGMEDGNEFFSCHFLCRNTRLFRRQASAVVHGRSASPGLSLTGVPGRFWKSWNSRLSRSRPLPLTGFPSIRSPIVTSVHVKEAEMSRAVLMRRAIGNR